MHWCFFYCYFLYVCPWNQVFGLRGEEGIKTGDQLYIIKFSGKELEMVACLLNIQTLVIRYLQLINVLKVFLSDTLLQIVTFISQRPMVKLWLKAVWRKAIDTATLKSRMVDVLTMSSLKNFIATKMPETRDRSSFYGENVWRTGWVFMPLTS